MFEKIYYEPAALDYTLGKELFEKFKSSEWIPILNHNNIEELRSKTNKEFKALKSHLVIGIRKTHAYRENHKVSDYLVPFTSSGCSAMCLYCYLVCSYNKCSYLRIFVNREEMMNRLIKKSNLEEIPKTFEIGSNSDLILENTITGNLEYVIEAFAEHGKGYITFPTKFCMVDSLLNLNHKGKTIFRMSLNPEKIIKEIEIKTSPLLKRIEALNKMADAGYKTGILIAPIILVDNWREMYSELFKTMAETLSKKVKANSVIEIIFMTYSYVQNAINTEAFPDMPEFFQKELMTGRGRGKYCYKNEIKSEAQDFLINEIKKYLGNMKILYVV